MNRNNHKNKQIRALMGIKLFLFPFLTNNNVSFAKHNKSGVLGLNGFERDKSD